MTPPRGLACQAIGAFLTPVLEAFPRADQRGIFPL